MQKLSVFSSCPHNQIFIFSKTNSANSLIYQFLFQIFQHIIYCISAAIFKICARTFRTHVFCTAKPETMRSCSELQLLIAVILRQALYEELLSVLCLQEVLQEQVQILPQHLALLKLQYCRQLRHVLLNEQNLP